MFIFNGSFVDSSFFFFSHSSSRVDFIQGIVDETATLISHIVENRLGAHCNSDVFLLSFSLFIARLWSQRMHNEVLQTQVWCWRCCSLSFTLHERVSIATGSQRRCNKGVSLGRLTRPSKHRWNYYYYNSNGWRNTQCRLLLTALMRNWFLYISVVISLVSRISLWEMIS